MSCKVLIYSKYPLVEMGLSLFVANKINKIQISKTNNLDFLSSNQKYDLMIFDMVYNQNSI